MDLGSSRGQASLTITAIRQQPKSLHLLALGALIGLVLGVSASLLAVQHAEVGVASTLMALPPMIVLPISYFVFKEKIGWQALAGTLRRHYWSDCVVPSVKF